MGQRVNIIIGDRGAVGAVLFSNSSHDLVCAEKILRDAVQASNTCPSDLVRYLLGITYPTSCGNHRAGDHVFSIDLSPGDHEKVFRVSSGLSITEELPGFEVRFIEASSTSAQAYDPEANGWVAFPEFGSFNKIGEDGELLDVSMNRDGSMDMDGDEPNISEVGAPESQKFLDAMNARFGTSFVFADFSGR